MKDIIDLFERLSAPLRAAILERRIKLLRAEAMHKPKKVEKHERKLISLELELRSLKDKYKIPHHHDD